MPLLEQYWCGTVSTASERESAMWGISQYKWLEFNAAKAKNKIYRSTFLHQSYSGRRNEWGELVVMTANNSRSDTIFRKSIASSMGTWSVGCGYNISLDFSMWILLASLATHASTSGTTKSSDHNTPCFPASRGPRVSIHASSRGCLSKYSSKVESLPRAFSAAQATNFLESGP